MPRKAAKPKTRRGRPPFAPGQARDCWLTARVTGDELEAARSAAARRRVDLGDFVREAVRKACENT